MRRRRRTAFDQKGGGRVIDLFSTKQPDNAAPVPFAQSFGFVLLLVVTPCHLEDHVAELTQYFAQGGVPGGLSTWLERISYF